MGVLVVMKTWHAASELWLGRMMESVADRITAIAAPNPTQDRWHDRVQVVDLPVGLRSPIRGAARRLGVGLDLMHPTRACARLHQLVRRKDVDLVFVHYADFALKFDSVWRKTKKPVVVHCHGIDVTVGARSHVPPFKKRHSADYCERLKDLSSRATLVANSNYTAESLAAAGVAKDRIVVKHLGVPIPAEPPMRECHGRPIRIIYLGRLVDFKGPELVISAFERAAEQGLQGSLTIAGDGPLRLTCELARARSNYRDRIELVGAVSEDVGEKLRADCDVFTAHNCTGPITGQVEAFGVSIVEAMAAGLPVVTGRSGGVLETVRDQETGILVQPGDVEAHASAFLALERNPQLRLSLGLAGFERAKQSFSSDMEAIGLRRIFDNSLKNVSP